MPARSQCNRRIAGSPPGRTLGRITGSLGSGLEDLAKGVGAERGARRFTRLHDLVTRLKPGLLLPLRDQGPGRIAEAEHALVETIDRQPLAAPSPSLTNARLTDGRRPWRGYAA